MQDSSSTNSTRHVTPRASERHPLASRNVRPRMPLATVGTLAPMPLPPRLPRTPPCPKPAVEPGPGAGPVSPMALGVEGCTPGSWWCPCPPPCPWLHLQPERPRPRTPPHARAHPDLGPDLDLEGLPPTRVHPDSFSGSIRHALIIGYFFSLLHPELGPSPSQDRCAARPHTSPQRADSASSRARRWSAARLLRLLYAGVIVMGLSVQAALSLYREMTADSLWDSSVDMMFFGSATAATVLFLELGPRWRRLTRSFERVESRMVDFGYPHNLRRKMKRLTAVVLLGAAVEHILSVWSAANFTWPCYMEAGFGGLLRGYSLLKFPMTFTVLAYEHWKALVVLFFNFVGTFFWNFNHLFVMLISMPLSYRFKQINERLEAVTGKVMTDDFWRRARETYNELSVLCREVDDAIGKLVLLSFASNMYFICRQLLHSFRSRDLFLVVGEWTLRTGFWYNLYFIYSFGYMLLRTVLVSLFAASVNDQSRRPLRVLFAVPAEGYTHEVERFVSQVTRDHVALTGCRFFSVTRGLILTVAGTIISYEIVLMQLHPMVAGTPQKIDHTEHCGL
ncbi:Gustatory receptor for sugar taste 64e [Frankliniella fusca]|uniref:Gustatory receptor for sugar taste 64e n=1 Tax=Frankliniella fusca TaxID=407009 RepID=A0AAE1LAL6_9NEOP|nr:Gustatory receptor for sugar taste 64e [Frankliniella fusca]